MSTTNALPACYCLNNCGVTTVYDLIEHLHAEVTRLKGGKQ